MCLLTRRVRTCNFTVHRVWRRIQRNPKFLQSIGSNYKLYGDEPQLGMDEFITARLPDLRVWRKLQTPGARFKLMGETPKSM